MNDDARLLERVRDALRADPRIRFDEQPFTLGLLDGVLVMEGELADVAIKKLALCTAAGAIAGLGIVDRLCVEPAERMDDGMVRDLVRDALLEEPALSQCRLTVSGESGTEVERDPLEPAGWIDIQVADGIVTLDGEVPGLQQKRLAGVLAWWVPGSRDVVNAIGVTPPEDDNDDEITDAVRIALEKDPFVNPSQIRVTTSNAIVTLDGIVPTDAERDMAEHDAWYTIGVDDVTNRIAIGGAPAYP